MPDRAFGASCHDTRTAMEFVRFDSLSHKLLACVFVHAGALCAATITWDGGSANTNNWTGSNQANRNWSPNGAPNVDDLLQFGGTRRLANNNNTTADTSYAGLVFLSGAGAFTLGGNRITLGGDVENDSSSLQSIDFGMILSGTRTFFTNSGDIEVNGVISGSGSLVKDGAELLRLAAPNIFTGDTVIKQGTVEISGSGSLASSTIVVGDAGSSGAILDVAGGFLVKSGQTIRGIGTVIASSTYESGSIMDPGNDTAGILTNTGNIEFQSGSLLSMDLGGTSAGTLYDQVNIIGGVTLSGALSINIDSFTPDVGDRFFILNNDGLDAIIGSFSNASVNGETYTLGGVDFMIRYDADYGSNSLTGGNDVVLVVVPEPQPILFCMVGSMLLLRHKRGKV